MATETEYQRLFQALRARGELETVLDAVRDLYKIAEQHLRRDLTKKVLKSAEEWATFQNRQGQLQGYLDVLGAFAAYAKTIPERQPSRRPDSDEQIPE